MLAAIFFVFVFTYMPGFFVKTVNEALILNIQKQFQNGNPVRSEIGTFSTGVNRDQYVLNFCFITKWHK